MAVGDKENNASMTVNSLAKDEKKGKIVGTKEGKGKDDDADSVIESELAKRYEVCGMIGEGTYGVVYEALQKNGGKRVALKKVRLDSREVLEEIGVPGTAIREIILLRELSGHPNIVSLLEVAHSNLQLWLVFEYCVSDLKIYIKQWMRKKREEVAAAVIGASAGGAQVPRSLSGPICFGLPMSRCRSFAHQLLSGLAYCHARRILHRDLKPQNLLLNADASVLKLADFGLARTFTALSKPKTQEVVTLWYRAPELLLGANCYSCAVDMWSVGCIIVELVVGKPLFGGDSEVDTLFKIFRLLGTPNGDTWPGVTALSHFKETFPHWSRNSRHSLGDLMAASEISPDGVDLVARLLTYDPPKRLSAADALQHRWFTQ